MTFNIPHTGRHRFSETRLPSCSCTVADVDIFRALAWEVAHCESRQQDKDQGMQDQTTELGGTLAGRDPATENITGRLIRHRAGNHGIKNGWDNIKFGNVGHLLITQNKIQQA